MAAPQHGNGPNPERTRECVERIEALDRKRESLHMAYMRDCAVIVEDKKAVYEEAKSAWGIPTRVLKRVVKVRATERKIDEMRASLEGDEQETFDQIRHALGDLADTPLGQSVLDGNEDGEADMRSPAQKRREQERRRRDGALNAAATDGAPADNGAGNLADGIKPLH